jgi:hypothetical protein
MSALASFCEALLPPEAGGPDPAVLAAEVERFLARQPAPIRLGARVGAALFGARPALMTRPEALRPAADALKAVVLLVHGADSMAGEVAERAQLVPPARPDADLDLTRSSEWPSDVRCDFVVVGSGAGGAMAARTLARKGASVVVVEEGRRHSVEEFRSGHPLERFGALYRDGGATAAIGRPPVMLPIGMGVGGTTLVNSGTCYRTPEAVLLRWRDVAGLGLADPDRFGGYLNEVWETLQVAPVPQAVMGRNGQLALQGAGALGWRARPLDRNAPGCGGCCQCAIGCPRNAKFGVHLNALPQACAAGARIVCEARVQRVSSNDVVARRRDGSLFRLHASSGVVVAAGATETPPLLRRSGLGGHPRLGCNLTLHPAVAVSGRFSEPVVAWRGVLQSTAIEQFHERLGVLVEATSTPPGMGSVVLPGVGAELLEEMRHTDQLATLGAMVADLPAGRVHGKQRSLLSYSLTPRDALRLVRAIEIMGQVLFAAGATEVLTGLPTWPRVRDTRELAEAVAAADPKQMHVAAFHPVGSAAAGADPERFPVAEDGSLRGADRVWVADGSVLPTCPEVNPQVTIMAMSLAIAEGIR